MPKAVKDITFYIVILVTFGLLIFGLVKMGNQLEAKYLPQQITQNQHQGFLSEGLEMFSKSVGEHAKTPIAILLLQIVAILFVARVFGWLFNKIGQPSVIGEIVAGIVLGPSVFAQIAPETFAFLFSKESLDNIDVLSQIGLILFMFTIGMELDLSEVKKNFKKTILISHTGIIFPFFCGMVAAYLTYSKYVAGKTSFLFYALFVGIALSITAFPVLARIIQEKKLTKSHLGILSIASAANGDVTAWCLLAVVIAIAQSGTFVGAIYVILFAAAFVLFMFFVVRPFFRIIGNLYHNKEVVNKTIVAFMLLFLVASAYMTELLGIHALFGAFLAGVVMPEHVKFRKIMTEKVEDVSLCLFLPLFFVSTGLKTQIGLIGDSEGWLFCFIFIIAAIVGKVLGSTVAARYSGENWQDSWTIGALMNTRGLMELIVLNIGYEMKILPQSVFVMLVIMTLVTTFMTSPLMSFIDLCFHKKTGHKEVFIRRKEGLLKVLLSFGRASNGGVLLHVAHQIFSSGKLKPEITALHITVGTDVNPIHVDNFEEVSFDPIMKEARHLHVPIVPRYEIANDAGTEIVNIVNNEAYDFLLVGAGISLSDVPADIEAARHKEAFYNKYFGKLKAPQSWFYPGDLLKDKTKTFIEQTNSTVGVFVNRDFDIANEVLVVLEQEEDISLLEYAGNLIKSNQAKVSILDISNIIGKNPKSQKKIEKFISDNRSARMLKEKSLTEEILVDHNFMLIAYNTWNKISTEEKEVLQIMPSTLIVNKKWRMEN